MAEGTNIGKAYLQIVPSAKGIQGALTSQLNNEAGDAGTSAGKLLGGKLKAALATVGIGAALGKTINQAISEGANLEQSLGGVEAIFDKSADAVKKYAQDSWKTVGISANDYMENVTSFSAALINSMGKDTDAAAEVANQALIDMGDNANRFGTDMGSIQAAYQGFAKQNYTMLDNLKLGYGGTKTEMERLLKEASELSGVEYDLDNLGDVYSAIHVIQEELHVTGTTAKEGAETLSGSAAAMKAAWSDLLGNMAIGEDVTAPLQNLSTSIASYLGNLIPMVANVVSQLPTAIGTTITTLVPQLMQSGTEALNAVAAGLSSGIPEMAANFMQGLTTFLGDFLSNAGAFIEAGGNLISNLVTGIYNAIPQVVAALPQLIGTLIGGIGKLLPKLLSVGGSIIKSIWKGIKGLSLWFAKNWQSILTDAWEAIKSVDWKGIGSSIIELIGKGIKFLSTELPGDLKEIALTAWEGIKSVDWAGVGSTIIDLIGNGISWLATNVPQILKNIASTAWEWFKNVDWIGLGKTLITTIASGIGTLLSKIPTVLKSIGKTAWEWFKKVDWLGLGKTLITTIASGIAALVTKIPQALLGIGKSAMEKVKNIDWKSVGSTVINGIKGGILSFGSKIKEALTGQIDNAKKGAENQRGDFEDLGLYLSKGMVAGIKENTPAVVKAVSDQVDAGLKGGQRKGVVQSPSKLFKESLGKYLALGTAAGITEYTPSVEKAAEDMITDTLNAGIGRPNFAVTGNGTLSGEVNGGGGNVINFYNTINGTENPEEYGRRLVAAAMLELRAQ